MNDYRHGSHRVFSIHLHVVWIAKYRHKVLRGAVAEQVRDVVREDAPGSGWTSCKPEFDSSPFSIVIFIE
jgi:REP element-mobilizing transposase RayT